ncbi:hypothetical protein [Streptomyces varsoviensis]|uniref:MABP domain-containing protein n=1 Tax=Streptomyces varsoviensis TaxID=67373 RepID=A0ABR5JAR5_9ACTN|nr:hypothetical protein [Streptomyces varsoviensis]KOG90471.1 hypothetical protein ADK38_08615 [Streptomyces varsoviensis]
MATNAQKGITELWIFESISDIPTGYTLVHSRLNMNEKGKGRYLAYARGEGPALTNLVLHLAWAEPSRVYGAEQAGLNLNEGAQGVGGGHAVPYYLAYTTAAEEGDNEIIDIDVIKATDSPEKGWDRIPFDLNSSVANATALNLAFLRS